VTRALTALAVALLSGCGPAVMKPTTGSATLYFSMSANAKASPALVSPVFGTFYGDVYLEEDVSVTGPRADAVGQGSLEVAGVDLRTVEAGKVGDQTIDTKQLAPGNYVVLGFLDVNANGATSHSPDSGDPATLALTNKFTVVVGEVRKRTVVFELIYN
jgi:hypothetical protein